MSKKELIIDAAIKLITSKGIHNTPMSGIAKEAGSGMGTIYNYFPNKDILVNSIYVKIKHQEESLYEAFDSNSALKIQFETYFSSTIDFFITNPLYFRFMEQLHASPIITAESRSVGENSIRYINELLDKGKADRLIKDIPNAELLMFIGGTVLSYLRWYFLNEKASKDSLYNQINMLWDAIKD